MIQLILRLLNISLYAVIVLDLPKYKVYQCDIFLSLKKARLEQIRLSGIYGANNVVLFSRFIS